MTAGAILGAIIGYERDRHGRPVGLRTHVLVALSATTFMLVSGQFAYYQHFVEHAGIEVDASRIAASVVSGIGFLAGGAILRSGMSVAGLTTAAGLWLVTAIGMCAGAGMFIESVTATVLGVLTLTSLRRFEDKNDRLIKKRLQLSFKVQADDVPDHITQAIVGLGGTIAEQEYDCQISGGTQRAHMTVDVHVPADVSLRQLMGALNVHPGLDEVRIQSLQ